MKQLRKTLGLLVVIALLFGSVSNYASAKNIYFAGKYANSKGKVTLEQYSSPEPSAYGKNVGYAVFKGFKNKNKNCTVELYRKSSNKYQSREGFITVIVKKRSIVVKGGPMNWDSEKQYSLKGTYKLKKRYPRP